MKECYEEEQNQIYKKMKDSNQNNPNVGPFLSPRCNSKCKKSGPHFRYASTSTWVHGQCKTCDGEQTVRAARSTLPAGVTVRETFTSAAHSSARCDHIVRAGRRVDLLNIFRHKLFSGLCIVYVDCRRLFGSVCPERAGVAKNRIS